VKKGSFFKTGKRPMVAWATKSKGLFAPAASRRGPPRDSQKLDDPAALGANEVIVMHVAQGALVELVAALEVHRVEEVRLDQEGERPVDGCLRDRPVLALEVREELLGGEVLRLGERAREDAPSLLGQLEPPAPEERGEDGELGVGRLLVHDRESTFYSGAPPPGPRTSWAPCWRACPC
jgi:hypothetical protein